MAIISPSTFDPLKHYVAVRLQQGVPIVDADWNELEDVRKFELRAYLKWFVGDGVPEGNDGFEVVGDNTVDDFLISAGVTPPPGLTSLEIALSFVGRCLVDGMDVIIPADARFRNQGLHTSQPGAAALGAAWGVPVVPELPAFNGKLVLYLDVWERLVTTAEDPSLIPAGLGTESCARLRREWVVRARQSSSLMAPQRGDSDYQQGHAYYSIAQLTRRSSSGVVLPGDVSDQRDRRVLTPPAQIIEDTLGTTIQKYRKGQDRPSTNLRDAINALIRGEVPSSATRQLTTAPTNNLNRGFFRLPAARRLGAVWESNQTGLFQVYWSTLDLTRPELGFAIPTPLTTGALPRRSPAAAALPTGEAIVVYDAGSQIVYQRVSAAGVAAPSVTVASTGLLSMPLVTVSGDVATFIWHVMGVAGIYHYRRLRHTDNVWLDANPVPISHGSSPPTLRPHAAVDAAGRTVLSLFVGSGATTLMAVAVIDPVDGVLTSFAVAINRVLTAGDAPFVQPLPGGHSLIFEAADGQVAALRIDGLNQLGTVLVPGLVAGTETSAPTSFIDARGGVWLFVLRGTELTYVRHDTASGAWGLVRTLAAGAGDQMPLGAVTTSDNSTWLFLANGSAPGGTWSGHIQYRQLFTVL